MKVKKSYVVPRTTCVEVELELGFMNASIGDDPKDTESVTIKEQTPGVAAGDGPGEGWDNKWGNSWD